MSARYDALCEAPNAELERVLSAGALPSAEQLAGWEWRGTNTPAFTALLGIKRFIKGFFAGPAGLEGYNIPVKGLWLHQPSAESPKRFGFYKCLPEDGKLLLDYGASPRNAVWQPERLLRDYVVVDPEDPGVLLGKAYLALGALVPVSYFVLERLRPTDWHAR